MTSDKMATIIRYICERQNKTLQNPFWKGMDKVLGKPRKVFVITGQRSYFDSKPGTCWWFMANTPTSEKEVWLKEAGKFVIGWAGGLAAPFVGLDLASTGKDTAEAVSGGTGLLNEAVEAAVWECVRKTDNAWVIAIKNFMIGGCAAFEKKDSGYNVSLKIFQGNKNQPAKEVFLNMLGHVDNAFPSDHGGGVKRTREYAENGHNRFRVNWTEGNVAGEVWEL